MSGSAKSSQSFHWGRLWKLAFFGIIAYGASIYIAASLGWQGFVNWNLDLARKIAQAFTVFGFFEGWYAKLPQVIDLGKVEISNGILLPRGEVDVVITSGGDFATLTRVVVTIVVPALIVLLIIQAFRFGSYMLNQDTSDHSGYYPGQAALPFYYGGGMSSPQNTPTHEAETNKYDLYKAVIRPLMIPLSLFLILYVVYNMVIVPTNNRFADQQMANAQSDKLDNFFSGSGSIIFGFVNLIEFVVRALTWGVAGITVAIIFMLAYAPTRGLTATIANTYGSFSSGTWSQRLIKTAVITFPPLILLGIIIIGVFGFFANLF